MGSHETEGGTLRIIHDIEDLIDDYPSAKQLVKARDLVRDFFFRNLLKPFQVVGNEEDE